eukprot:GGOE01037126.1.p1 GENE.GGOE01037126.1~~GGOE01037126.1.p1  ORF type:complete len:233 (-),score=37.85 GGOE01037126.1:102-800(-)
MLAAEAVDMKPPSRCRGGGRSGLICTALLCDAAAVLMVVATAVPNWSASDVSTAGPWGKCILRPVVEDWYCRSMDLCDHGAFFIACRVFTVAACLATGLAAGTVSAAAASSRLCVSRRTLCGGLWLSFMCSCLSWGMWVGVASQCFFPHDLAPKLGLAFALACASSGLTLCSLPLALWSCPSRHMGHLPLADDQQLEVTVSRGSGELELSPASDPSTLTLEPPCDPNRCEST